MPSEDELSAAGPGSLSRVTVRLGHVVPGPSPVSLSDAATWAWVPLPCHCQAQPRGPGSPLPAPSPVSLSGAATWAWVPLPCHCQMRPRGPGSLSRVTVRSGHVGLYSSQAPNSKVCGSSWSGGATWLCWSHGRGEANQGEATCIWNSSLRSGRDDSFLRTGQDTEVSATCLPRAAALTWNAGRCPGLVSWPLWILRAPGVSRP